MRIRRFISGKAAQAGLFSAVAWVAVTAPVAGRIGERQGQIEDRLLADGTGQRMLPPDLTALNAALRESANNAGSSSGTGRRGAGRGNFGGARNGGGSFDVSQIDNLLWRALGQDPPAPDQDGVRKRPPEFPEYVYFKTDDGSKAAGKLKSDNITGWELRVYLYKQLSGLEVYHRVGAPLSDTEVAAILNANRGATSWVRAGGQSSTVALPGDETGGGSFIGYEFERADGQVRALRTGNDLVLFSTELDRNLIKVRDALSKAAQESGGGKADAFNAKSTQGF